MPRVAKFKERKWADGSYKVEVEGATKITWWKMYDPLPDEVIDNKQNAYKLDWKEEVDLELGTIKHRPVYRKKEARP